MLRRIFLLLFYSLFVFSPATLWSQSYGQVRGVFQKSGQTKESGISTSNKEMEISGKTGSSFGESSTIGYQVHLLGQVQQPGTYHLSPSTRLDEAINRSGGVLERGSTRNVELRRNNKVYHYDLFKFERQGDLSQNPFLMDNDVIFVPYSETNVVIQGPVKNLGNFELVGKEKSIQNLVELAGGFTVGMQEAGSLTVIRYVGGEKQLLKVANEKEEREKFELLNGDIVIVPHIFSKNRRFDYNISELPADNQLYPTQKNNIFIMGSVAKPGPYVFIANNSVRDYVGIAGMTEVTNFNRIYVLTADGKYVKHPDRKKDFHLSPGDTIVVPHRELFTTDNVLKWYNTFTGTVFSVFAFKQFLNNL